MGETTRDIILAAVGSFPALSSTATRILKLLNNPTTNMAEVEQAVKYDPGLTANILRMANSAYFGFPGKIASVSQAIGQIGWNRMYHLVIASAVNALMDRPVAGYDLQAGELWHEAIAAAISSEVIVRRCRLKKGDEAFTGGLLRDVGKLIIGDYVDTYYEQIEVAHRKGIAFEDAEREVLGTDHSEVGAWILEHWSLPKSLVEAIRWHSNPEHAPTRTTLIDIVHLADALAIPVAAGLSPETVALALSDPSLDRLGLRRDALTPILQEAQEGFAAMRESLRA